MKKGIIAIAVIAIVISSVTISYYAYFSSPFDANWKANIGYSSILSGGTASGAGNYYVLSIAGVGDITSNYTTASYVLNAFNSTTGQKQWDNSLNITVPVANLLITLSPGNKSAGDMPQIHFWNNALYLGSYFHNFTYGERVVNNSAGMGLLLARISPSNGILQSYSSLNLTNGTYLTGTMTMNMHDDTVYLGLQSIYGNMVTDHVSAIDLGSFRVTWNTTFEFSSSSIYVPGPEIFVSGKYLAIPEIFNGSGVLYSLKSSTGSVVTYYGLSGVSNIGGIAGNNFVLGKSSNGSLSIVVTNLTGSGIDSFSTDVPYTAFSTPTISIIYGEILVSLNSKVYAYSPSGRSLWVDTLQNANANYYLSGFIQAGNGKILYWSEVSVFYGTGNSPNYRVTYNHFTELNSTNGQVSWERSYSPASSFFMNQRGNAFTPVQAYHGKFIYQWYSPQGYMIAVTGI